MTPTDTASSHLRLRLATLNEALHRAYCMAVCLDRALRHNASDDAPELAVCVHEYLVRPLDALGFEAAQLKEALATSEIAPTPTGSAQSARQ